MPPNAKAGSTTERASKGAWRGVPTLRSLRAPTMRTARAIGRTKTNRNRHENALRISPETVGPMAGATEMAMLTLPITAPRLASGTRVRMVVIRSGSMIAVPPQSAFHCLVFGDDDRVSGVHSVNTLPLWENGGYFVLRQGIFDVLPENGDLVEDACGTLAGRGQLLAYPYRGFWQPADTAKERAMLEEAWTSGRRPWMVWSDRGETPGLPLGGAAPR